MLREWGSLVWHQVDPVSHLSYKTWIMLGYLWCSFEHLKVARSNFFSDKCKWWFQVIEVVFGLQNSKAVTGFKHMLKNVILYAHNTCQNLNFCFCLWLILDKYLLYSKLQKECTDPVPVLLSARYKGKNKCRGSKAASWQTGNMVCASLGDFHCTPNISVMLYICRFTGFKHLACSDILHIYSCGFWHLFILFFFSFFFSLFNLLIL